MSVAFVEMQGSPKEGASREGFFAVRTLQCDWNDRLQLYRLLMQGIGQPYPHFPMARVRQVDIAPFDGRQRGTGSLASYDKALLTVRYETPQRGSVDASGSSGGGGGAGSGSGQLVSERLQGGAEFITLPVEDGDGNPLFRWSTADGDPLSPAEAPGKIIRTLDYTITRYEIPSIPADAYSLMNTVNESAVTALLLGVTFPAGTLLYQLPEQSRVITTEGVQAWTLTQSFSFRPDGWNKFWRVKTGTFEPLWSVGLGAEYQNHPPSDFTLLS